MKICDFAKILVVGVFWSREVFILGFYWGKLAILGKFPKTADSLSLPLSLSPRGLPLLLASFRRLTGQYSGHPMTQN
jgi:hypothetical protein